MSDGWVPRVGQIVSHGDWGKGRVTALLRGGRVLRVEFDEMLGTPWEIPREELGFDGPAQPEAVKKNALSRPVTLRGEKTHRKSEAPKIQKPSQDFDVDSVSPETAEDSVTARQSLEALRLGVVPDSHLNTYTVGRDMELAVVYEDLQSAAKGLGGMRVVLGDYGAGKTHFLEMAELLALESGFLATRATLDSREIMPSRPRRIYHELARGIRYPDDPSVERRGLKPLLQKAAADVELIRRLSRVKSPHYHPYLGPALFYWSVLSALEGGEDLRDRLLDWIEGSEVASNVELEEKLRHMTSARARLYALRDFRTVTHLYTLLLGGISELARQVGYRGLAVMVDEAEFYSVLGGRDRTFADILFRTFAAACLDPKTLGFDPEALPRGGQAVHRRFSYRYRDDQPLYAVFALTHDPAGKSALARAVPENRFMSLPTFSTNDYITLSERVLALYELAQTPLANGKNLAPLLAKVIEPCHKNGLVENPRQALKFITEVVDITRHRPDRLKPMLQELLERLKTGMP
ncbi:MAG: ATP-binding protein [Deltaproteobacteria bacterium]|nr:ATP-binding protein [Deltaproteobacteria bacterium]